LIDAETGSVPGIAAVAVASGEVIYADALGERRTGTGDRLRPESLFAVADITQTLVATALMQLVSQEVVALDEPVVRYVPYFHADDPQYDAVTVRQLLEHTSGLPPLDRRQSSVWKNAMFDDGALERVVRDLEGLPLWSEPGRERQTSSLGYDVLGDLLAKVDGMSFEETMTHRLLRPLKLRTSSLRQNRAEQRLLAAPHELDEEGRPKVAVTYPYTRGHAPGLGLITSPEELGRWMLVNLNRGVLDGERILPVDAFEPLWELAWDGGEYQGRRILQKGGTLPGFAAHLVLLPDEELGAAVLCHLDGCPAEELTLAAVEVLLEVAASP
jgi:CubicO group peptidase (beta-lactamase class C family)